jgi:hypothetical protein
MRVIWGESNLVKMSLYHCTTDRGREPWKLKCRWARDIGWPIRVLTALKYVEVPDNHMVLEA